jgi:hypothetical protein
MTNIAAASIAGLAIFSLIATLINVIRHERNHPQ